MSEQEIYVSIAERFLEGGNAANGHAHELSGFACYHAFESVGGALVTNEGRHYPRIHHAKLNAFVACCHGKRFRFAVAALAIKLNALRNSFLYPTLNGSSWSHPMKLMTPNQVKDLHRRVSGIVRTIRPEVS